MTEKEKYPNSLISKGRKEAVFNMLGGVAGVANLLGGRIKFLSVVFFDLFYELFNKFGLETLEKLSKGNISRELLDIIEEFEDGDGGLEELKQNLENILDMKSIVIPYDGRFDDDDEEEVPDEFILEENQANKEEKIEMGWEIIPRDIIETD